ncbi:MAG: hypothetical protein PHU66_03030 [Bacteroidaceae bacterium]|nr:hypothetical protein [Bacteroidaceae bacterium]
MKKLFLCGLMLFAFSFLTELKAQDTENNQNSVQKNTEKVVEETTQTMAKQYGLDEEQTKALKLLNAKRAKDFAQVDSSYDAKTANAAQKAEVKKIKAEIQSNYDTMLKDLFSDKQYQKYLEDEASKKEQIKGNVNWMANAVTRMLGENNINLLGWNGNVSDSLSIAQKETDKMVKKYKLDKTQEEKLLALNIAEVSAEIAERRNISLDNATPTEMAEKSQDFVASARRRSSNYERYLKEILDEKQYKKYTNSKKAQETRNQRFNGFGGFGGPPMF